MDTDIALAAIYKETTKLNEKDAKIFSEAVQTALTVCKATAPNTRLKLVETPTNNFLLVTNVVPSETSKATTEANLNIDAALEKLASSFNTAVPVKSSKKYLLQNVRKMTSENIALTGSYIIYTKKHIEVAFLLDKSDFVQDILRYAETPSLLGHTDVRDLECLLWLAFCGPISYCQADNCFGLNKAGYNAPFPILFPPCMYERNMNLSVFFGLLQIYVFSLYRDFSVENSNLQQGIKKRIKLVLSDLRAKERICEEEIGNFPLAAQICLFCALYRQNRLCMEYAANNLSMSVFSPIILKDCTFMQTTVTITQILPGSKEAIIFPVYDIGKLLSALVFSENGVLLKL